MEEKAKKTGRIKRSILSILGEKRSQTLLARHIKNKYCAQAFTIPIDATGVKTLLCIMPEQKLEAVHQIGTVLSFVALFKNAKITILCTTETSPFIKNIQNAEIVEYSIDEREMFSQKFTSLAWTWRNNFDICIMLEKNPVMPLLYLAGQTSAPIRAGYDCAGAYPFINYRIKPSENHSYLGNWNNAIGQLFGTKPTRKIKWSVTKETIEEVRHVLRESSIDPKGHLIGIDLVYLIRTFGRSWCEMMLRSFTGNVKGTIFIYSEQNPDESELSWMQQFGWPILPELSIPRTAALISTVKVMITGNTVLFAMASLLDAEVIGLFEEQTLEWYCPQYSHITGISFKGEPDQVTIKRLIEAALGRIG